MVAIIGRPNVGKSSLFNRLAGRRIAIVHEEAGVTRDRIVCSAHYKDRFFELVDTGGLADAETAGNATLEQAVHRQVHLALQEASVIILVVDVRSGLMPADEKAAALLRKSGLPGLLAANKTDNEQLVSHAPEFEKLGFQVFAVSALHNRGMPELLEALRKILPACEKKTPPALRIALIGRPNTGKSSLVNCLAQSERMIVSGEPGTTRDSVAVALDAVIGTQTSKYILIDTAGMRPAGKIKHPLEIFGQLRARESLFAADAVVLVLDASQGPTAHDKNIAAGILDAKKSCVLALNKWDLVPAEARQDYAAALRRALPFLDFVPVVCTSAVTGHNVSRLVETIHYVAGESRLTVPTAILNRMLQTAAAKVQPPLVKGRRLKIFYATQTATKPISFLIFVNDAAKVLPVYEKYLNRTLRKAFGFEGVPIVLKFRTRKSR